jgi:hypothetical protein
MTIVILVTCILLVIIGRSFVLLPLVVMHIKYEQIWIRIYTAQHSRYVNSNGWSPRSNELMLAALRRSEHHRRMKVKYLAALILFWCSIPAEEAQGSLPPPPPPPVPIRPVHGIGPISAACNAVGLASESPVVQGVGPSPRGTGNRTGNQDAISIAVVFGTETGTRDGNRPGGQDGNRPGGQT